MFLKVPYFPKLISRKILQFSNSSPGSSDAPLEQTDGNVATMSSGSSSGSPPKKSEFNFFRNIIENTAEEAVIRAEKHADQERGVCFADSWGPISHIPHHDNPLGEQRAASSDDAEQGPASEGMEEGSDSALDLTIKRIMWDWPCRFLHESRF